MRILKGMIAGALIAGFSVPAMAQTNGWYTGAEAGVNMVPDMKLKGNNTQGKTSFDPGFGLLGQVGYGFGAVRVEGELGWRYNGVDKVNSTNGSGTIDPLSLMGNVYYDFNLGGPVTPYIGVGVGAADVMVDKLHNANSTFRVDDSAIAFAYQGIVGLSYAVSPVLAIKGDYRYLATTDFKVKDDASGAKFKGDYQSHALLVGFTYKFAEPAKAAPAVVPAAAPAPAPAPKPMTQAPLAKSYLVFFDFDKSDITPEANRIIQQAAASAKSANATSINLIGHTDAAGSEKYNQALSLRRANAVKAVLVKLGVPANEISVVGKGKSEQLVPTKDGVREPQNRRVQIVLP